MTAINPICRESNSPALEVYKQYEDSLPCLPNFFGTLAHSPSVFKSYIAIAENRRRGELSEALHQQIGLTIAGEHGTAYCISAHTRLALEAGISEEEVKLNVRGISSDRRTGLILRFVMLVMRDSGQGRSIRGRPANQCWRFRISDRGNPGSDCAEHLFLLLQQRCRDQAGRTSVNRRAATGQTSTAIRQLLPTSLGRIGRRDPAGRTAGEPERCQ